MKTILVLGSNGFIGCALMRFLGEKGYDVYGIDNNSRERNVDSVGAKSVTPVKKHPNTTVHDIAKDYVKTKALIGDIKPDVIVHLAEQPSAPFSMIDGNHAAETQRNNIVGTMNVLWAIKEINPGIQLIKLGTAGQYPDWLYNKRVVPETPRIKVGGWEIPTPRYAGSFYHFSKLFDAYNIDYACRIWGLNCTELNQGVIYGHKEGTRLDVDEYFGTVVHRFCAQAVVGEPLTVYGGGGQNRGFIALQNALEAIELVIKNPAKGYRIIHQLTEVWKVRDIAALVRSLTGCAIENIDNPRVEMQKHSLTFEAKTLKRLGLKPISMLEVLPGLIETLGRYKDRIKFDKIETTWK
jgi:UDP-sulfoquinovose synthase